MAKRSSLVLLARLDAALCSRGGLVRRAFAVENEVSLRTVQRLMDAARDRFGCDLEFDGRAWRHADLSRAIFTEATRARAL